MYSDWLSNEALKSSKHFHHVETNYSSLKDKSLEFFQRKTKKHEHEEWKQLLKATISLDMCALTALFLVGNHTAKAKKPFTVG